MKCCGKSRLSQVSSVYICISLHLAATNQGGSLMSESIWQHPRTGTNHNRDRGCNNAIERQHGKVHFTIKCCVVARVFINHTHKVGEKMFPFKLLEVYYIKNKKSGKRSENIMVKKFHLPLAGLDLGPPTRESDCQTTRPARLCR